MNKQIDVITTEYFTEIVAADLRRKEFDIKNHSILSSEKSPDFIFIGDSITQFWELNNYFDVSNNFIINRGIAGDTTTYLNKRFEADVLQLNPKYCILGIGINDSIALEGDYWKQIPPLAIEDVLKVAQNNISEVIEKSLNSKTKLILTSLLPIAIPVSLNESLRRQYIKELNHWLSLVAKDNNLLFINYYTATTLPCTSKPLNNILHDGLHPNGHGYNIMTLLLKNNLAKQSIHI